MTKQCRLCATDHLSHAIVLLEEAGATGMRPPVHPDEVQEIIRELHRRGPQPLEGLTSDDSHDSHAGQAMQLSPG